MVFARVSALTLVFIIRKAQAACADATCTSDTQMSGPHLLQRFGGVKTFRIDAGEDGNVSQLIGQPAPSCAPARMEISSVHRWGGEMSWEILENEESKCQGPNGPTYPAVFHENITSCCLEVDTAYTLLCKDSFGDGWHGANITINGDVYCESTDWTTNTTATFMLSPPSPPSPPSPTPPPPLCVRSKLQIKTTSFGDENSWEISESTKTKCKPDRPYRDGEEIDIRYWDCCLEEGIEYTLLCRDSYGDGWHGGHVSINGTLFCAGFKRGYTSSATFILPLNHSLYVFPDDDDDGGYGAPQYPYPSLMTLSSIRADADGALKVYADDQTKDKDNNHDPQHPSLMTLSSVRADDEGASKMPAEGQSDDYQDPKNLSLMTISSFRADDKGARNASAEGQTDDEQP